MKNKIGGFTLLEMSIVILIFCFSAGIIYGARTVVKISRLANAINLTAQFEFVDDENLVLWLETSNMSKENKSGSISNWKDFSKNVNEFKTTSGTLAFNDSRIYPELKAIKFNGSNYLSSSIPLNLNQYTAFLVAKSNSGLESSINIFDSGLVATVGELSSDQIITIKNTGSTKYKKSVKDINFAILASNPDNLTESPEKFDIGHNFGGEILEIIIFDRTLENSEVKKIEKYLINKYMR